jgi:CRISPR-associated protein Cas1
VLPRILDISDSPARLSLRQGLVVIDRPQQPVITVPLCELAVVLLAHPQVSLTQPLLASLSASGAALIVCDERRLPAGMLLPLVAHTLQAQRMAAQASIRLPTRKRLWQQIVRAKIRAQAGVLAELRGDDGGLLGLLPRVRSGDPTNVEAQAARRYWSRLFPGIDFRRDFEAPDANRLLNYGYAVLRAIVARAIAAAGLHPSLGLHHHHRANPYCLADDLMEPLRPVVDRIVARYVDRQGRAADLSPEAKHDILSALTGRFPVDGQSRTLLDIAAGVAQTLAEVCCGRGAGRLTYPERIGDGQE